MTPIRLFRDTEPAETKGGGYIIELDVAVVSNRQLDEHSVVDKVFSSLADQDGIDMVVSPLHQTKDRSYNQGVDAAIEIINDMQGWVVDNGDERFLATHKEKSIEKLKALKK